MKIRISFGGLDYCEWEADPKVSSYIITLPSDGYIVNIQTATVLDVRGPTSLENLRRWYIKILVMCTSLGLVC